MSSNSNSKYNVVVVFVVLLVIIIVVVYLVEKNKKDDNDGDVNLNVGEKRPYVLLEGLRESNQCPSEAQKLVDGMYLPTKTANGIGEIEKNDFPVYENENGYILLKADTGGNFNVYKNTGDVAEDKHIAYITADMKIHTKLGCPEMKTCCTVSVKNGATLKKT